MKSEEHGNYRIQRQTSEVWQGFRDRFMELAREEQGREKPITAGSAIRHIDQVLWVTCSYKNYSESIASDAEIVRSYKEMMNIGLTSEHLAIVKSKLRESKAAEIKCGLKAPAIGRWIWGDGISENFQERVRSLVAHAGAALGSPKDADPNNFWLHQLWLDFRKNGSDLLFAASEESGMILSVCVASATFCARLERQAIQHSEPVNKGQFCDQVTAEMKRIRNLVVGTGRAVAQVEQEHPGFAAWKVRAQLSSEDQDVFNHPRQWGPVVGYAKLVLSKIHGVSPHTITSWVKAHRKGAPRAKKA